MELAEEGGGFAGAGAPGDVVAFGAAFVEVVHLDGEDAFAEEACGLDGVDAEAEPVAEVGRGADARAAAFTEGEDHLGAPGVGGDVGAVVVDADVDAVFVGEAFEEVELVGLGFADEGLETHLAAELEEAAGGGFVGGDGLGVVNRHAHADGLEF